MEGGRTTVAVPSYRKRVGYQTGLVGGMALLASALLIVANQDTKDVIAQRLEEDVKKMLAEVIPNQLHNNDLLNDVITVDSKKVYQAKLEGDVSAVAFEVSEEGYSGLITLILAINAQGEILGTRVISHTETPGLGDKMEEKRTPWIFSFNNLSFDKLLPERWLVKKDGGHFDQFTGATITPRAVVKAIKSGMLFFQKNKQQLLTSLSEESEHSEDPKKETADVQ
jgi:electron transport complex protein RnfG